MVDRAERSSPDRRASPPAAWWRRWRELPRWAVTTGWSAGFFLSYLALGWLGGSTIGPPGALWFPSAALTLTLLWVRGPGYVPVVVLSATAADWLRVPGSLSPARFLPSAIGLALAYALAAVVLRRVLGARPSLARLRDLAGFAVVGVGLAPALSAVLAVTGLRSAGLLAGPSYRSLVHAFWLADLVGVAAVGPAVLWLAVRLSDLGLDLGLDPGLDSGLDPVADRPPPVRDRVELAGQTVALGVACWLSFGPPGRLGTPATGLHLSFLYVGVLAWIALRHRTAGAALAVAAGSALAVLITGSASPSVSSRTDVQVYLAATAVIVCFLGAAVRSRDVAEEWSHPLSLLDEVTGLPNRVLFTDRLAHALIRSAEVTVGDTAVLALDLDRFSLVNNSLGHDAGDRLLRAVAWRLATSVRPSDTVARFGADEFMILLEDVHTLGAATATAQRLLDALGPPVNVGDQPVFVNASVGVVLGERRVGEGGRLVREAIIAQHRAKKAGPGGFAVYDAELADAAQRRLVIEHEVRTALATGALHLSYQPVVNADGSGVMSVESLLRWEGASGPVPAAETVAIAEEAGLMVTLGGWILEESCRQLATWRAYGGVPTTMSVSVNVSASQLADPRFVDQVRTVLERTRLPADLLAIELTESVLVVDATHAVQVLQALRALGVRVHIDDFGTGYSSLSYLTRLPLDALKVDISFVSRIGLEPEADVVIGAVIGMAHALGLAVIAEGVETTEQALELSRLGCTGLQGYLVGKPLTPAEVPSALAAIAAAGVSYTHPADP